MSDIDGKHTRQMLLAQPVGLQHPSFRIIGRHFAESLSLFDAGDGFGREMV